MKKTTIFCLLICTLTNSNISFGMLAKETFLTKKHFKSFYTKKNNNSHSIKKLLAVYPPDKDYFGEQDHNSLDFEDRYEAEQYALRDLYRRNHRIITILSHDINNIQQKIQLLKKQQDLAIIGSSPWVDEAEMKKLEKQLHESFKVKKLLKKNE